MEERYIDRLYRRGLYYTLTYMRSMKSALEVIPALCDNELSTVQTSGDVMR